jgi:hypothetical protein
MTNEIMDGTTVASGRALEDYLSIVGKVVVAGTVQIGHSTVEIDPPAVLRVSPYTDDSISSYVTGRWMDGECLAPIYDVELLEPHPMIGEADNVWLLGQAYTDDGNELGGPDFVAAPDDMQRMHAPTDPAPGQRP